MLQEKDMISKISFGTAQLGMTYGVANKTGKPTSTESKHILKFAFANGINCFDTSPNYGNSETILGNFFENTDNNDFAIITKIPSIQISGFLSYEKVLHQVKINIEQSIQKLKVKKIPVVLLHDPSDMNNYEGLITRSLIELKKEGLVGKIGASIYSSDDVQKFLKIPEFDAIQIPINLFDTRLIKFGLLNQLINNKKLIFARSLFLQGLFFLDPFKLPYYLHNVKEPLIELNKISIDLNINIPELAFKFVNDINGITSLVIGVDSLEQLENNVKLLNSSPLPKEVWNMLYEKFNDLPEEIINPSIWNR